MKKSKIMVMLSLIAVMVFFFPVLALAQEVLSVDQILNLDPGVVAAIMAGIGGFGVIAITELLKGALKIPKIDNKILRRVASYGLSIIASAGITAYILKTADILSLTNLLLYTAGVFAQANGLFKTGKNMVKKYTNGN